MMTADIMLLLFGSAFILGGVFGLIEVAIRGLRRRRAVVRSVARSEEMELSPPLVPTEEDLEMLVARDSEMNPDGQWRQDLIRALRIGEEVSLVLEDAGGRQQIRIVAHIGTIGYVPDNSVPMLVDAVAEGKAHSEVVEVARSGDFAGAWIAVSTAR